MFAFDNMDNRAKGGPFDWRQEVIVLDVPESAAYIYFGLILDGNGTARLDDAVLELVDWKTKLTGSQFVEVARRELAPAEGRRASPPTVNAEPDSTDSILRGIARAQSSEPAFRISGTDDHHLVNAGFERRHDDQK